MALTGIITKPRIGGTVASVGPGAGLFAKTSYRVYPFQVGCSVRTAGTIAAGGNLSVDGLGEFAASDFFMVCTPTAFGDGTLYIPNTAKIVGVTSVSAVDDILVVTTAVTVAENDWLLNVGVDGSAPSSLALDGSDISIFTDNAGNETSANKYMLTATGGSFHGWLSGGFPVVDLLITNSSDVPQVVWPLQAPTPEVEQS